MPKPVPTTGQPSIPWSPQLCEEITDLLAEALYQDFQAIRKSIVNSPQGSNHRMELTENAKGNK
jgi:hypothetical protein